MAATFATERKEKSATVTVPNSGLTDVLEVILNDAYTDCAFELAVTGQALADFAILIKPHSGASYHKVKSSTDWNTLGNILTFKLGTLQTLAAGATGYGRVDVGPCYAVKFQAQSANVAGSPTTVRAAFYR